ncbi:hypothetical protein [uncultured Nostoc sp.]|uniref:hypothetical protein n=1 Tax=uncultured Nostoc sp. TaxID=340711 RepID=UPI0035C98443
MNTTQDNPKPAQKILDILCLQRLCPACTSQSVHFITYELDNEIYFECDSCNWELTTKLDVIQDAGLYPLHE